MITDTSRLILSAEELAALPYVDITALQLRELETHLDYNPISLYQDRIALPAHPEEMGHDAKARYLIGL